MGKLHKFHEAIAPWQILPNDGGEPDFGVDTQPGVDAGAPKVAVDQKGLLLQLSVGDGQVNGYGGFAFGRSGAGDHDRFQTSIESPEQDRVAERADGFLEPG